MEYTLQTDASLYSTSIVILTHNQLVHTQLCIQSIRDYTSDVDYEIIVIDNASTDGTREWLHAQPDLIVQENLINVGFPAGCNQGIQLATRNNILLLNNDTVVTSKWLKRMTEVLYEDEFTGAVGPITNNCSYYQAISVSYSSLEEMQQFAKDIMSDAFGRSEYRLKLVGFCILIKRSVIDTIGLLDEQFSPGNFEDDDLSYRMVQMGYRLKLCRDVFIHHTGSVSFGKEQSLYHQLLTTNQAKFEKKWGFNTTYSSFIRYELLQLLDQHDSSAPLRVLEIGCACGATLLEIKNRFPQAELYGIELNPHSSAIAETFAKVQAMNAEEPLSYPQDFFDYIILADVLEHLYDPWKVLANLRNYLKVGGYVLSSIPNLMHVSALRSLINGQFTYTDAGLLDRTHIRFFTLYEIERMFVNCGFINRLYSSTQMPISENDQIWIASLMKLSIHTEPTQFNVYQYLVKAEK